MTLKNDQEFLVRLLDDYSSGETSLEMLARRNSISPRALFMWMRDKDITLDYMGRAGVTFGQAMAMARNVMKAVVVSRTLEDYVSNGRRVEVWHHGKPQFEEDEALVALGSEFVLDVLGLPDMYRRDLNGNRIIATRVEYAPAQLIEKYASANMPSVYGDKREVTMRGNVSLGVTTIGTQRPLPANVQEQIGPVGPMASGGEMIITETVRLAPPVTDTPTEVFVADDPELDEMLRLEPVAEPERIIRDVPTARETPSPQTGILKIDEPPRRAARTPLEQSLYDELDKMKARKAGGPV